LVAATIREALKAGRSIEKMLVARANCPARRELVAKAREAGVVVQFVDRARLDAVYPNHQGSWPTPRRRPIPPGVHPGPGSRRTSRLCRRADGVTEPHNLGAIIRTAECCGATGDRAGCARSAGLNPAAVKAAGRLSYLRWGGWQSVPAGAEE
jgi:23S rRNA (guanosine2251-2'-O)-methyltransferase